MQYVSPCIVTISAPFSLTDCQRFFEQPATARQRQYEALRAYFLEEVPSAEAARSFGYSPGAFRVLCHAFRHGQLPDFFATGHAVRAALALKLWSIERKSHVMALVADEGLALFCGLNAMPKKSIISE